jgi:sulfur-carrier protein
MQIEVRLFASLRQERFAEKKLDFPAGTTVADVLRQIGIAPAEVAILLVNGQHAAADRALAAGDVLSLFPLVAGG